MDPSPLRNHSAGPQGTPNSGEPQRLAGPGTSRQTRRLQLRNAGFRGSTIPTRKSTPKSFSPDHWSSVTSASGAGQYSDAENVSPSGSRTNASSASTRESSGILQEIGNATLKQPKRARTRVSSSTKFLTAEGTLSEQAVSHDFHSPSPRHVTVRQRSIRTRATTTARSRRSISGEARQYLDHLETELAAAQAQISAMTSPSVTRQQSYKMRHLNAETKHLEAEIADWEAKYEKRVQEEVDKHFALESTLRSRIRELEQEADEAKFRVESLETQLLHVNESLDAVETANVNLEKRIEIMSDLLAASPTKIDFHLETPSRVRHARPTSVLPRFPTAGSLIASPERSAHDEPLSPTFPFPGQDPSRMASSPNDFTSDAESFFSDTASVIVKPRRESIWSTQTPRHHKVKPTRRMRRFGAGSMGPKSLILPSTTYAEQLPASTPAFERGEMAAPFGSPKIRHDRSVSPSPIRRRSSTDPVDRERMVDQQESFSLTDPAAGPDPDALRLDVGVAEVSPPSALSIVTTRNYSSLGSALGCAVGRNLMEELEAAKFSSDDAQSHEQSSSAVDDPPTCEEVLDPEDADILSPFVSDTDSNAPQSNDTAHTGCLVQYFYPPLRLPADTAETQISATALTPAVGFRSPLMATSPSSMSTPDRIANVFNGSTNTPMTLARYLVQAAQSCMHVPATLHNIQWWLVGNLLGPMASRRMLGPGPRSRKDVRTPLLDSDSVDSFLAYGSVYRTAPPSSSPVRGSNRVRNRSSDGGDRRCSHCKKEWKHSPWLWLKFSLTLAVAVGCALKHGPGTLLKPKDCDCDQGSRNWRHAGRDRIVTTPK